MIEIDIDKEYPAGTPIDFAIHGVHGSNNSRFTVMTHGLTIFHDCLFEGHNNYFSTPSGEIITNVRLFRLQPK